MENSIVVNVGKMKLTLPLVHSPSVSFYSFNMMGNTALNVEAAKEIVKQVKQPFDCLVTIESKAIALTQEIAKLLNIEKYVVVRKSVKSYMLDPQIIEGHTILSGQCQYVVDQDELDYMKNKKIMIVDDVISTCGTIDSVITLLQKHRVEVSQISCVFLEGNQKSDFKGIPVISCGFFPLPEKKV